MNEGRKDDAGKPRLDLLPSELVLTIVRVLTFGATKCGDWDWERVIAWGRVFGIVQRYLWVWWGGEDTHPEMGYSHLSRRAGSHCGVWAVKLASSVAVAASRETWYVGASLLSKPSDAARTI